MQTTVRLQCMPQTLFKEKSERSEHPPVRGENVKTFRSDHRGCKKYKTSSWHFCKTRAVTCGALPSVSKKTSRKKNFKEKLATGGLRFDSLPLSEKETRLLFIHYASAPCFQQITTRQGAEHFMAKWIVAEKAKAGLRHAVVCPNVTGRTKERIAQSKRARAGSLALVDLLQVAQTCILRALFGLQQP